MEKWTWENLGDLFLKNEKTPDDRTFLPQWARYWTSEIKEISKKDLRGTEKKYLNAISKKSILAKMTTVCIIRPKTPSFWPGQSSLAPPMLVNWWQAMTHYNRDWHQSEIAFGHLAGVRGTYKNKLSVQAKQTVDTINSVEVWGVM